MRNWPDFRAGTEEAILPLDDIMAIMSTPRHSAKLSGHYISAAKSYAVPFVERLKEMTRGSSFWEPKG